MDVQRRVITLLNVIIRRIFGGANRKLSDKYGLTVTLCHDCHNEPPDGIHHNKRNMFLLHVYGQMKAMKEQGWTRDQFREIFGRNYLEEDYDDKHSDFNGEADSDSRT